VASGSSSARQPSCESSGRNSSNNRKTLCRAKIPTSTNQEMSLKDWVRLRELGCTYERAPWRFGHLGQAALALNVN
jgi:hypothetical protein